jgi:replicative superfamily II helicase
MERVSSQQIIIFVHSRRDTVRTAKQIKESAFAKD